MEAEVKPSPLVGILKAYVLPAVFWTLGAFGAVTFASEQVMTRLDRIETNLKHVQDEQERVKEEVKKLRP